VRIGFLAQTPKRTHERDRIAAVHSRVQPALLRQIADLRRRLDRPLAPEDPARAARRVDDAEEYAQRRRLAGTVGAEEAVNRSGGNREADAVDRPRIAEILDQVLGFDRPFTRLCLAGWVSKHRNSLEKRARASIGEFTWIEAKD
jgi:hypothetical protein